jgi:hypothetical protein
VSDRPTASETVKAVVVAQARLEHRAPLLARAAVAVVGLADLTARDRCWVAGAEEAYTTSKASGVEVPHISRDC